MLEQPLHLLVPPASSFFNSPLFLEHSQSGYTWSVTLHLTVHSLCDLQDVCHTIGQQVLPTQPFQEKQRISPGKTSILRTSLCPHS